MAHKRTLIRTAIVTAVTGLATTGSHVFVDPVTQIEASNLPCLVVQTGGEEVAGETSPFNRLYQRRMDVQIDGIARAAGGVDAVLDQIALEVEAAINADVTLGGVCLDTRLTGVQIHREHGDQTIGRLSLDYQINYVTEA